MQNTMQSALQNEILLVHPNHAYDVERARARIETFLFTPEGNTRMRGDASSAWGYRVENGVAIIPVMGTLISRGAFVGSIGGVTSYEGLRAELARAANDPKVEQIVLAIDSPGGMVSGIDSAAQAILSAREKKPVIAHVEGRAASAAYWLAAQADEIALTPMSEVGSIGVVAMHVDYSKMLGEVGIKPTLIYSGAHKVDGNPFEPLPDAVRATMQMEVDRLRLEFARAVSAGRSKLQSDVAMATDARMYPAENAISLGLADRVASLDDVIASKATARQWAQLKGTTMAENSGTPAASGDASAAVAAAMQRAQAITGHAAAKGREALASKLAFEMTSLSTEQAIALLEASPAAAAETAPQPQATVPPIAQRAQQQDPSALAGAPGQQMQAADVNAMWGKVVNNVNAGVVQ